MAERLSWDDAYNLAVQAGATPEEARILAAIAGPESGYNPQAHNPNASTGDNSYGLWQVNMLGQMGVNRAKAWGLSSYEQLFDPLTNAKAAVSILRSQGFGAWTAYKNGSYQGFLQGGGNLSTIGGAARAGTAGAAVGAAVATNPGGDIGTAVQVAGGMSLEDARKLASAHGDTLGDRLNAIHSMLMGEVVE